MVKLVLLFAILSCTQICFARRVTRDAATPPTFSDITKQAEEVFGTLHTKFLEFVGVSNDEELTRLVQTESRTYANKIQDLVKQLGSEAKANAEKADDVVKSLQEKLTQTVDELRQKNPELFKDADKFQESLKAVIKDTEVFNEKLKSEGKEISANVETVIKQIYDNTVQTAKTVATEIETIVKEKKQ